jgi:hypothetical protein
MKSEEFRNTIYREKYLLDKGVRNAAYIYPVIKKNIEELDKMIESDTKYLERRRKAKDPADVEWNEKPLQYYRDSNDKDKLWLYIHDSIGRVIKALYGLPYIEHQIIMGLLLGYTAEQEDLFIKNLFRNDGEYIESTIAPYDDYCYKPIHPQYQEYDKVKFVDYKGKKVQSVPAWEWDR